MQIPIYRSGRTPAAYKPVTQPKQPSSRVDKPEPPARVTKSKPQKRKPPPIPTENQVKETATNKPPTRLRTSTRHPSKRAAAGALSDVPTVIQQARPQAKTLWTTSEIADDEDEDDDDDDDSLPLTTNTNKDVTVDDDEGSAPRSSSRHVTFASSLLLDSPARTNTITTTSTTTTTSMPPPPPIHKPIDILPTTTTSGVRLHDTETMKIFPERFEEFQTDEPAEFYAGNKPPWAARIQNGPLAQARKWKVMEIYDNYDLTQSEWYAFCERVAGYCGYDDPSEFARTETYGEKSGTIAPSRVGDPLRLASTTSSFGAIGGGGGGGGAGRSEETLMTPDIRGVSRDGGPSDLFAPRRPSPLARGSTLTVTPTTTAATGGGTPGTIFSEARFKEEREELMERLHEPDIIDDSMAPKDREARRQARVELVRALPWINRPLVTGVFLLSAKYTAALASAYAKTQIYSATNTTLQNVPMMEFMRRRSKQETNGDMASFCVRETFAEAVATLFFLTKDSTHRGSRFEIDRQANIDRSNELLRVLRNRFGYNSSTRNFYDVTAVNDERYKAEFERPSARLTYPFASVFPVAASMSAPMSVGPSVFRPF
jgi:hypothetical protein